MKYSEPLHIDLDAGLELNLVMFHAHSSS